MWCGPCESMWHHVLVEERQFSVSGGQSVRSACWESRLEGRAREPVRSVCSAQERGA